MNVNTNLGKILAAGGAAVIIYSLAFMEVSLPHSDVVNIHLISRKQNALILGGFLLLAGIIITAIRANGAKCPHCAETINREASLCKHCGRDVAPSPLYTADSASSGAIREGVSRLRRFLNLASIVKAIGGFVTGFLASIVLKSHLFIISSFILSTDQTSMQRWEMVNSMQIAILFATIGAWILSRTYMLGIARTLQICSIPLLITLAAMAVDERFVTPGLLEIAIPIAILGIAYLIKKRSLEHNS